MRLLYFSRDYTPHDHRFLYSLARTGHEIFYLRLERRGHSLEDRPLPSQVEQVRWSGGQGLVSRRDGLWLLNDLKRALNHVRPDVVHAGPIQTAAFLVALAGFHPLVSMSWGYDLLVDASRSPLWRWATRYTLKRSAVMVGDCQTIRDRAVGFGMANERIITFPWGVDLNQFNPGEGGERQVEWIGDGERDRREDVFVLLSNRSWEPVYGVDVIARAFVIASRKLAERDCPELRLLMLGNGSQATALREIFTNGGVADRVHYPGHVSQSDLPRFYRSADLYVSASHSDGSSISLLEAMACGLPVLVSDIPGNKEWVTPGQQGWWFRDGDPNALAEAIVQVVAQRLRLPEMGLAARLIAEQRADWDNNFLELLNAYELAQSIQTRR